MRKVIILAILCMFCSSCLGLQKVDNKVLKSLDGTVANPATLVYEHIKPMENKKTEAIAGIKKNEDKSIVSEIMGTKGAQTFMENTPELGMSLAAVVAAFTGNVMGIIPGLVGLPV